MGPRCAVFGVAMVLGLAVVAVGEAAAQATGAITGVVTTTATARPPVRITTDTAACGRQLPNEAVVVNARGQLAHAVVTVTGVRAHGEAPELTIANDGCRFVPRVQVARPGQVVRTVSRDAVLHTTTAVDASGRQIFNIALPVPGLTIARPLGDPGIVRVVCQMHPWMLAWLVVTPDLSAVSDASGRFHLPEVPPGTYTLRVWHETLGESTASVTVRAGQTATISVAVNESR